MTASPAPIRVDIVSDVVCPWCVIGYRQLATAAEAAGVALDVHWHPFELNPDIADEGENLRDHLIRKYGISKEDSVKTRQRITDLGAELGFTFDFTDDMRTVNTFRAHQLIALADSKGLGHAAKQALQKAYFTDGLDVSDIDTLAGIAGAIGLDPEDTRDVLRSGTFANQVRKEEKIWTDQGVSGVPTMIFAEKYAGNGAMGVETYAQVLRRVVDEA